MKMNLNEYNAYTVVHNGGLYKATIWRTDGEYPFELRVCYVDDAGASRQKLKQRQSCHSSAVLCVSTNTSPKISISGSYLCAMVEMRGVEPLSEGSLAGPSPSADCDLKFPHDDARSQASAIGSFMLRTHGKAYIRSFPA